MTTTAAIVATLSSLISAIATRALFRPSDVIRGDGI